MDVTVIGTGKMAHALAARALSADHKVTLHGTSREQAERLSERLQAVGFPQGSIHTGVSGDEINGDLVILAVWYEDMPQVLDAYGERLRGKVLVDITNPIDRVTFEPLRFDLGSAAQEIQRRAPAARVVKAFNTTFPTTVLEGGVAGEALDVFVAADDDDARWMVTQFIEDCGLRAIDAGPLRRSRELEALGYLHMAVQAGLSAPYTSSIRLAA
jgi:hypothetical protein